MSRTTAAIIHDHNGHGTVIFDEKIDLWTQDLKAWLQKSLDSGQGSEGVWVISSWADNLTCTGFAMFHVEERDGRKVATPFSPHESGTVDVTRWPPRRRSP